jgi:hypothetical protein
MWPSAPFRRAAIKTARLIVLSIRRPLGFGVGNEVLDPSRDVFPDF